MVVPTVPVVVVRPGHGHPLPPPAVVECLRGVPTYGVDLDAELVTPTGATTLRC